MAREEEGTGQAGWRLLLASALGCGICTLAGVWLERASGASDPTHAVYALAFLLGGWDAAVDAARRLRRLRVDIHFLMIAVALGAAAIGSWWEGATLLFLFSLSNALEAFAMARADREIRSLFHATPKSARVVAADGSEREVPVASLLPGQRVRILPGQLIPADGRVLEGRSSADEASLSGESEPRDKAPGDPLFGGTLNLDGALLAEVTKLAAESAHARIIRLIREAQASKAPSQRFTDRFGSPYTIGLLAFTALMFAVWHWGFGLPAFREDGEIRSAFYRAMTLLVVCSPCALVISIPSAVLAGIAAGARRGILFRGGVALESLATIRRLAVDKTGTLTRGEPELRAIECEPADQSERALALAASLGRASTHPLSRAIAAAHLARHGAEAPPAEGLRSHSGAGMSGSVDGLELVLGRRAMAGDDPWISALPAPPAGDTEVILHGAGIRARFLLRDAIRPEARATIAALRARGVEVTMLTGDRPEAARHVAEALGLDGSRAALRPEDKVAAILEWRARGEIVAMAGDGVNDAPSLAAADLSIGMGLRGSDAVLEQADVVLTRDRLDRVVEAHDLSRRCRAIIRQNLAISLGVVLVLAVTALFGWIPLPLGVLGHEGSTLVVVLNSLRLLSQGRGVG